MNAAEHAAYIKARMSDAPLDSLRRAMYVREGVDEADDQIRRGRRAWAVERRDPTNTGELGRPETAIVFGTCRSDAIRRAQYGARLGMEFYGTDWRVAEIKSGWDEPFDWPLPREVYGPPEKQSRPSTTPVGSHVQSPSERSR